MQQIGELRKFFNFEQKFDEKSFLNWLNKSIRFDSNIN